MYILKQIKKGMDFNMKKEIGKRIQSIRENMNMSKESFAKLLGISGQYLGMIEHGKSNISIENLKKICDISNLSSDYILFGKDATSALNSKKILSEFTDEQIENAFFIIKTLSNFIKNT